MNFNTLKSSLKTPIKQIYLTTTFKFNERDFICFTREWVEKTFYALIRKFKDNPFYTSLSPQPVVRKPQGSHRCQVA